MGSHAARVSETEGITVVFKIILALLLVALLFPMFMAVLSVMFYVVIIAAVMGCVYYILKPLTKDK